jgi:hypothetical protein
MSGGTSAHKCLNYLIMSHMSRRRAGVQCWLLVLWGLSMSGNTPPLKQQAHELIDNLPESATWDDVAYEAELRASIEHGLADAQAGRVVAVEDLMKELGVEE